MLDLTLLAPMPAYFVVGLSVPLLVTALVAGLALIGFVAWLTLRSVRRGVRRRDMLRPF